MTRLALALFLCAAAARAHDPITTKLTFTKEIVRLFHKHCANCHRDGGPAPFSLMTYESARPWATAIKEEVLARRMPPWGAVKGFGEFQGDLGLTQEELHLIADWIEGGAPEGDPVFLPQYPNLFMPETEFDYPGPVIARTHKLRRPLTLHAVRPETAPPDNTKLIARLPNGEIRPIIWFYGLQPKFLRQFWLRTPLRLPAGTELTLTGDAALRLITKPN